MTGFHRRDDLLSWGRVLRAPHEVAKPLWRDELPGLIEEAHGNARSLLAVGLRRSYGDSGLNPAGTVLDMTGLDRAISFDPQRRLLRAEAGMSFDALLKILVPLGYFLPVTPGTRFVTLGGAVANDVHGKNHQGAGTFGTWVRRIGLLRPEGSYDLDEDDRTGLFAASIGGLGLTGVITFVECEVVPIASEMMDVETVPFGRLDDFFRIAAESDATYDFTVAWIDCLAKGEDLGRGLFTRARHAAAGTPLRAPKTRALDVPIELPEFMLNGWSVRAFNALYYTVGRRKAGRHTQHYRPFFYPLDAVGHWNSIYGRRGMYQYQSVVPPEAAAAATRAMLSAIAAANEGSFLAVLKTFGDRPSPGLLSFPRLGTTLALDFPNRGASTLALMERLDAIVREAKGRVYPAKDGRIPAALFREGYPQWEDFARHVAQGFSSHFWARVGA